MTKKTTMVTCLLTSFPPLDGKVWEATNVSPIYPCTQVGP